MSLMSVEVRAVPWVSLLRKDPNPLNLVKNKLGSLEKVGSVANALLTDPQAFEKDYYPEMEEVIRHTPLMEYNTWWHCRYNFINPDEPGQYPSICSFPGHWKQMRGILTVETGNNEGNE